MSKILRGAKPPPIREDAIKFTSPIKNNARHSKAVIDINKAHVVMLIEQKIISQSDGAKLLQALNAKMNPKMESSAEDVHMAVEEAVLEETGPEVGGTLHIAKSRNDQVTTAIRMELRKSLLDIMQAIVAFQENLAETAEKHVQTSILEYTHLQPAQPVTFAHYWLSRVDARN